MASNNTPDSIECQPKGLREQIHVDISTHDHPAYKSSISVNKQLTYNLSLKKYSFGILYLLYHVSLREKNILTEMKLLFITVQQLYQL